ncbi:hypothetical protein YC2023_107112 [Brassica napus]
MIGHIQKQLAEALLTCIHHGQTAKPDTKYTHKDKDKDKDTDLGSVTVQNRKKSQRTDHYTLFVCFIAGIRAIANRTTAITAGKERGSSVSKRTSMTYEYDVSGVVKRDMSPLKKA